MALEVGRQEGTCTLFGFGSDLDWRRWMFSPEPLKRNRCRDQCFPLWVQVTVLRPHYHSLCAGCYSQCVRRNYACMLDAESFWAHDVAMVSYPRKDPASGHIRCPNVSSCGIAALPFVVPGHRESFQYKTSGCSSVA